MNRLPITPLLFLVFSFVLPVQAHAVCISGDCKNGYGIFSWANGERYEGYFKDGQANGQGTREYVHGDKYVGEYKDGKKNGYGTYFWAKGDKFVGEYKDGKRNGQGTKTYADGDSWTGEWHNGKRVWQPKKNCPQIVEYRDETLYEDFKKVFDKQVAFDEANEALNKIKKDLISDTKTWYRLAGTNDWSVLVRTIARRIIVTTNLIANLASINPETGAQNSITSTAPTETSSNVYEALLSIEAIEIISIKELEVAYEKLILSSSGGLGSAIRIAWNLADDIKEEVYLSENHAQLKTDMDRILFLIIPAFSAAISASVSPNI